LIRDNAVNLPHELERYSTNISQLFDQVRNLPGGWVAAYLYRILYLRRDILNRVKDDITEDQYTTAIDKYNQDISVFEAIEIEEKEIREGKRSNNNSPSSCKTPPNYRKDDDHFGPMPRLIIVNGGKKSKKSTKSKKSNKTKKSKKSKK
jgi:hypothetical protein